MKDKVVLVTGANGGLGRHVTQAFLDAGAAVVGVSRNARASDFNHPSFMAHAGDLSTEEGATTAAEFAVAQFSRLDVLAHLAGGFEGGMPVAETGDAAFQAMFDANVKTSVHIFRVAIPHLRRAGHGRVIAIGSRFALEAAPNVAAYSASKAALIALVRAVAAENRDAGVTANILLPGTIDTPANRRFQPHADSSKWVQPARLASLILWLAGDDAQDVTGSAIPVYGTS